MFFRPLCHACYVCELCALLGMVTLPPHILCVELAGEKAKAPPPTGLSTCAPVLLIPCVDSSSQSTHGAVGAMLGAVQSVSAIWSLYMCLHIHYRFQIAKSFSSLMPQFVVGLCVCVCVLHFISLLASWGKKITVLFE